MSEINNVGDSSSNFQKLVIKVIQAFFILKSVYISSVVSFNKDMYIWLNNLDPHHLLPLDKLITFHLYKNNVKFPSTFDGFKGNN